MAGIARSRLTEERRSWRRDHPLVRAAASFLCFRFAQANYVLLYQYLCLCSTKGFFARLDTDPDGCQNLLRSNLIFTPKLAFFFETDMHVLCQGLCIYLMNAINFRWKCGIPGKEGTIWAGGVSCAHLHYTFDYNQLHL
jgi:hypothetical protein